MRFVGAALVVVGLLVGLGAAQSFWTADGALSRADANAAQLVRLQDIQTSLVRADADATNAFLVGGLEPVEQRRDYDTAVARAASQVAFAARAQPADGEALAALSTAIQDYTGAVVQARASNRQGLPVGAQYLRDASAGLRADALPLLEALTHANEGRAETEFTAASQARSLARGSALAGLVLVALAMVWLARRTHRYVNVPVLGAGVVVLVVLLASAVVLGSVGSSVATVRAGPYAQARALSDARISAFDAKSNESLTLISRGSGAAFEAAWVTSAAVTTAKLAAVPRGGDNTLEAKWVEYTDAHVEIRALDDGGSWEQAVAAATSRDDPSANASFERFGSATGALLTTASETTSSALRSADDGLQVGALLGLLAGLAAAVLGWRGLAQRIEEYR